MNSERHAGNLRARRPSTSGWPSARSSRRSSGTTNANGPVPTGWVAIWPLSTFLRDTIAMPLNPPRLVSRFGVGCLTRMTTVAGSGALDVGDGAELVDVGQLLVDDAAVGVDDVVGGERAAVVERHALAQVEGPGQLIGRRRSTTRRARAASRGWRRVRRACRTRSPAPRTRSRRWSSAGRVGRARRRSRRSRLPGRPGRGRPVDPASTRSAGQR